MVTEITSNYIDFFECKNCDFKCCKKGDWNRHLMTAKHKSVTFGDKLHQITSNHNCTNCRKIFKSRNGLWSHNKKCSVVQSSELPANQDLITYLMKENGELKNMIMDVCKTNTTTNISNINNNSNNKTFNLNMFLNEECKDAMNIMEFVDSLQLQLSDLENVGRLGFVSGISDIIIKNLKALDIHKRPVHCTDLKREVMYVKDENQWNKEADDNIKIRRAIKCIAQKNTRSLALFKQKHPDCLQGDSRSSDQYNKLVREAFGGGSDKDDNTSENKIISRLSKEITIDKFV